MSLDTWVSLGALAGVLFTILGALFALWTATNRRSDQILAQLTARMDRSDSRIDRLEAKLDHRFDTLTTQLYDLNTRVTAAISFDPTTPRAADG